MALSTSICPTRTDAQGLERHWLNVRGGHHVDLATDPSLPLDLQRQLLRAMRGKGIRCAEIGHPAVRSRGRAPPSPASADCQEQAAAAVELVETLQLAQDSGTGRVVLYPWALPLQIPVDSMRRQFARGMDLELASLAAQRRSLSSTSMDGIRRALDRALPRAEAAGTVIALFLLPIWPHQTPNATETLSLLAEFSGAPMGTVGATDWEHAALLAFEATPPPAPPDLPYSVRLADACGLTGGLPLDRGEAPWRDGLDNRTGNPPSSVVLALDDHTVAAELTLSLQLLGSAR